MLDEYRAQAIVGVWGGVCLFGVGYVISGAPQPLYVFFGRLVVTGAVALFISGCFMYARGKGRSWYWGLLGLLGPVGLLLLYCLKDRSRIVLLERRRKGPR